MKQGKKIVDGRRDKLLHLLELYGTLTVDFLSKELKSSPLTIRRDLDTLGEQGLVDRFYGGASLRREYAANPFSSTLTLHKHAIARAAAALVEDGDTVFLNISSTALLILQYITARQVTVITNNAKAVFYRFGSNVTVVLTGGELSTPKEAMVGDFALSNLSKVTASKCFIGCAALTEEEIMTAILQEATINTAMLEHTIGAKYVVADHTKIGRRQSFRTAETSQFTGIITDTETPRYYVDAFRSQGLEVLQVPPLKKLER